MSMHFRSQHDNTQSSEDGHLNQTTIGAGLLQAAHTLGSIGTPATHSRSTSNTTTTTNSSFLPSSATTPTANGGAYPPNTLTASSHYRSTSGTASYVTTPSSTLDAASYFDTQRPQNHRRTSEEQYSTSAFAGSSNMSQYQMTPSYGASESLPYPTAQQPQPPASGNIPGALQSGPMGRPGANSMNTTPGSLAPLPQISTQLQEPTTPQRPPVGNHSHSYSRSSPAGLDHQKYKSYSNTVETPRINPPTNFPLSASSATYSPLALTDIRPRGDTGLSDGPLSPSPMANNGEIRFPGISNHIAPWPIYALDWCKWPVRQNGVDGGKIALGSYLEDSHNYVCDDQEH